MVSRIAACAIVLCASPVLAQPKTPPSIDSQLEGPSAAAGAKPPSEQVRVHHAPVSVAKPHEALDLEISIVAPQLVKRVVAVVRTPEIKEFVFLRSGEGYVARIPAEEVVPPGLSYAIELETLDGKRQPVFASREAMHPVQVADDLDDLRERQLLSRVDGRRSAFLGSFDFVSYGSSSTDKTIDPRSVRDYYYRAEASYVYRPLRFVVEFGIKVGLVRGHSPVGDADVGLNYGAPTALFRVADRVHFEVTALTSVTEVGFSSGIGGALHIGDVYGSKLILGGETVKTFGNRGWARLDIARGRLRVSPVVEVGNIPNAKPGVRLFTEVAYLFANGFFLSGRFGYQARDFSSGGPGGGAAVGYAF